MSEEIEAIANLGDLPDDPLSMPPPYWRSGQGIFNIQQSVDQIAEELLPGLVAATKAWEAVAEEAVLGPESDENPYPEELDTLMDIESEIVRLCDLAIFMAAIESEDVINQFAVYNLHKDSAEAIETLSPPDKLILVSALVGAKPVKSTAVYESIRKLTTWRNAVAHGHCTDRPTGSLRKNHLISPGELPTVPAKIGELHARLGDYFRIRKHLESISINPYTAGPLSNDYIISVSLATIKEYRFTNIRGRDYEIQPPADQPRYGPPASEDVRGPSE